MLLRLDPGEAVPEGVAACEPVGVFVGRWLGLCDDSWVLDLDKDLDGVGVDAPEPVRDCVKDISSVFDDEAD